MCGAHAHNIPLSLQDVRFDLKYLPRPETAGAQLVGPRLSPNTVCGLSLPNCWVFFAAGWRVRSHEPGCQGRDLRGKTGINQEDATLPTPVSRRSSPLPLYRRPLTKLRKFLADQGRQLGFLNGRNCFPFLERLWVIPIPFLCQALSLSKNSHKSPGAPRNTAAASLSIDK